MTLKVASAKEDVFFRPSALWTPEYLDYFSAWFEHGPFAFWLTDALRPRCFVELGTHAGYSYFCFCQAVQRLHLGTSCYAVDTWTGDEHSGLYGEDVFGAVTKHNQLYTSFSTLIRSTFDDALSYFPDKSIDLLHIDGRHFYEDVRHDFESWRGKLTDDAIILFHDTNVRERQFGVWKLFEEIKQSHATFEFMHGHGLGMVALNKIPPVLKLLFAMDAAATNEWRQAFATLGNSVTQKWQAHVMQLQLQDQIASHEQEKLQAQHDLTQLQAQVPKISEKTAMLATLLRLSNRMHQQRSWLDKGRSWLRARINPEKAKLIALRASVFFDADWYLVTYSDVVTENMDPARHYLDFGADEGRDPGPFFSTLGYFANNPDIGENRMNPLLHFEGFSWFWKNRSSVSAVEVLTDADRRAIQRHIEKLQSKPLISVVMPVYNTTERFLRQAIESVIAQSYSNWELCIANDASPKPEVAQILNEFAEKDQRIKVVHRETNGNISAATNSALELAKGEFVALMDHDDLLHVTALYEVVVEINAYPDVDVIYSDEDYIDENGIRSNAYYKSDFNPELLLGQNMISHLGVFRRSLIEKIGGFRMGFEGSQDYDLVLRAWAASSVDRIRHIPAILYHWRQDTSAPSFSEAQLEKCVNAARWAIQEFLDSEGEGAKVIAAPDVGNYSRIVRKVPEPRPLVSVIVPTKDRADLLSICANGILNKTDYTNVELLIVDHESQEHKTLTLFEKLKRDPRVRVLPYKGAFNYSAMNNMAAVEAKGGILALVNNDIEVIAPDWLTEMVSHAVRPEVGAVGAKLLYPDDRIQHAGVVIGLGGVAGHAFHYTPKKHAGYFCQAALTHAVSAVTGACLVVRKSVYFEVDGLNAEYLTVAFNDVDFCLKIQAKGYRNVWSPFAELVHHESESRGTDNSPAKKARFDSECAYMCAHWQDAIENDPFYNPNLALNSSNYGTAKLSRRRKPWAQMMV